jgi:hypothetical protein
MRRFKSSLVDGRTASARIWKLEGHQFVWSFLLKEVLLVIQRPDVAVHTCKRRGKAMKEPPLILACVLLSAAMFIAGCVAGNPGNRQLESLSVSPATASANGSAVQFTAAGYWSSAPITVMPQSANWGACTSDGATTEVTVSANGLASCASGATGTYMVFAWDPDYGGVGPVCNAINACGGGCGRVSATAQLTCP